MVWVYAAAGAWIVGRSARATHLSTKVPRNAGTVNATLYAPVGTLTDHT